MKFAGIGLEYSFIKEKLDSKQKMVAVSKAVELLPFLNKTSMKHPWDIYGVSMGYIRVNPNLNMN